MDLNVKSKNIVMRRNLYVRKDIILADLGNDTSKSSLTKVRPAVIIAFNNIQSVFKVMPIRTVNWECNLPFDQLVYDKRLGWVVRDMDIFSRDVIFHVIETTLVDHSDIRRFSHPEVHNGVIIQLSDAIMDLLTEGLRLCDLGETEITKEKSRLAVNVTESKAVTKYKKRGDRNVNDKAFRDDFMLYRKLHTLKETAEHFGVSVSAICHIQKKIKNIEEAAKEEERCTISTTPVEVSSYYDKGGYSSYDPSSHKKEPQKFGKIAFPN